MKITKRQLRRIIKEERVKLIQEAGMPDALRNQFDSVDDLAFTIHDIGKGNADLQQAKDYIGYAVEEMLSELYNGVFYSLDVDEAWMKEAFSEACNEFLSGRRG